LSADPRTFIVRQVPSNIVLIIVSDCGISLGREKESRRADLRTADLLQIRVCSLGLLRVAQVCKYRIGKGFSLPCIALYYRVLRAG
jgi:hypothetical protein